MALIFELADGTTAELNAPERTDFDDDLKGAIAHLFAMLLYKTLEWGGTLLGVHIGSVIVGILDRLEPELVKYTKPLIDYLLEQEELPEWLREFFEQLQAPSGAAGTALLTSIGTAAGGTVITGVLGVALSPLTYFLNGLIRPARPSIGEIQLAKWRGEVDETTLQDWQTDQGWPTPWINAYEQIFRPRLDSPFLYRASQGGLITVDQYVRELQKRGYTSRDAHILRALYRPLLDVPSQFESVRREIKSPGVVRNELSLAGWEDDDITALEQLQWRIPGAADLVRFAVREVWKPGVVAGYGYDQGYDPDFGYWMERQGYKEEWARAYWHAHWMLPSVTLGYQMLHRDIIKSKDELRELLKISDFAPGWIDKMIDAAYKPFTRVDVRRMYRVGVLEPGDLERAYMDIGYDAIKAAYMKEFTLRYEKQDGDSTLEDYKDLSRTMIERLYRKGMISRDDATNRLGRLDFAPDDANLILGLIDIDIEIDNKPDMRKEFTSRFRTLTERAYTRRLLSRTQAQSNMEVLNVPDTEVELSLALADYDYAIAVLDKHIDVIGTAYVKRAIGKGTAVEQLGRLNLPAINTERLFQEWELDRTFRDRRLTEAQYRKAVKSGIIQVEEYAENCRGLGYTEYDIGILVKLLTQ